MTGSRLRKLGLLAALVTMTLITLEIASNASHFDGNGQIYSMESNGSNVARLSYNSHEEYSPTFSTDGEKIAFYTNTGNNLEIFVMNKDGTGRTQLTFNTKSDASPSFSPDDTKIVFNSSRDGKGEIYVMNTDGTDKRRLTNNEFSDTGPKFSPDGTKIAFNSRRNGSSKIFIMNSDGLGEEQITTGQTSEYFSDFSPDGSRIAFSTWDDNDREIFTKNIDGSGVTRLTSNEADDIGATFSPDGERIGFISRAYEIYSSDIFVMDVDGSNMKRLTDNGPIQDKFGDFSADGSRIIFTSNRHGAYGYHREPTPPRPSNHDKEYFRGPRCTGAPRPARESKVADSDGPIKLSARLSPYNVSAYPRLKLTIKQEYKTAIAITNASVKLGDGSTKLRTALKKLARKGKARRKGKKIGSFRLASIKGTKIQAAVFVKRGRLYLKASKKRRYRSKRARKSLRHLLSKTKLSLSGNVLKIKRFPRVKYRRIDLTLDGNRGRFLKNPKSCGTVNFSASFNSNMGKTHSAISAQKLECSGVRGMPFWLSPVTLSAPDEYLGSPDVAVDGKGRAAISWDKRIRRNEYAVNIVMLDVDGRVGSRVTYDAPRELHPTPRIVMNSSGDAAVVWRDSNGVKAASRKAGGSWGEPITISAVGDRGQPPEVAINDSGTVVVAWNIKDHIQSATKTAIGAWTQPIDIPTSDRYPYVSDVELDSRGNAFLVWTGQGGRSSARRVLASSRPAGGSWSAPSVLGPSSSSGGDASLALDAVGNSTTFWGRSGIVMYATRKAKGKWGAPRKLSMKKGNISDPKVAANSKGDILVVWSVGDDWRAISRSDKGRWSDSLSKTRMRAFKGYKPALNDNGDAVVMGVDSSGKASKAAQAIMRPAGGSWSRPVEISSVTPRDSMTIPDLAMNRRGDVATAWIGCDGLSRVVKSSLLPHAWTAHPRTSSSSKQLKMDVSLSAKTPSANPALKLRISQRRKKASYLKRVDLKLGVGTIAMRVLKNDSLARAQE